jgi:hypothetical protein
MLSLNPNSPLGLLTSVVISIPSLFWNKGREAYEDRTIAQAVTHRLPTAAARVQVQVGSYVDNVARGQVFSEYFGFPRQSSFLRLLHIHHHRHHLSSVAGTIGQLVADVPSGLSLTPPQETKLKEA